jgi:hypothetical protein
MAWALFVSLVMEISFGIVIKVDSPFYLPNMSRCNAPTCLSCNPPPVRATQIITDATVSTDFGTICNDPTSSYNRLLRCIKFHAQNGCIYVYDPPLITGNMLPEKCWADLSARGFMVLTYQQLEITADEDRIVGPFVTTAVDNEGPGVVTAKWAIETAMAFMEDNKYSPLRIAVDLCRQQAKTGVTQIAVPTCFNSGVSGISIFQGDILEKMLAKYGISVIGSSDKLVFSWK